MATSDYTDEDLYLRYRPYSASDEVCWGIIDEHRARFPEREVRTDGDWTGTTQEERDRAILEAVKRAAQMPQGPARQDLLAHAMGGARVRAKAAK